MEKLAAKFLEEYYGLSGKLKRLNAYASENYLVETTQGKYILKVYINDPRPDLIEAENSILLALSSNESLGLPRPIQSINGEYQLSLDEDKNHYDIRLLSYVEGTFLAEIQPDIDSYQSLGSYMARLDKELLLLKNPVVQSRTYHWNIQHIRLSEEKIQYIKGAAKQNLVRYFIMQYREHAEPTNHRLRHSILHNDSHEWNILTEKGVVTGAIDFGDIVFGPLVQEVAITICYAMMASNEPWQTATTILKSYHEVLPLTAEEIELIYHYIGARLCVSVCSSATAKSKDPDNDYITISEKPAWALLEKLLETNPVQATHTLLEACEFKSTKADSGEDLRIRNSHLSKALSLSYSSPIKMHSAAFQYMYAADGTTYLDCANNIFHVGHGHPKIVHAAQRQLAKLNTNTRYLYDELNNYAEKLLSKFDKRLNKVFFVNSGSAATDLALRLSRNFTGTNRTMVMDHGYHGNTAAGIEVSAYKFNGKGGSGKADHIMIAPLPDEDDKDVILKKLINDLEADEPIGTFIAESIVGCGGQVPLSPSYIQGLHQMIRLQGGICIADEVQTGFGRVGSHFWAFETQGLSPDIVILGKPMGNGHPLAAVVTTNEIAEAFENGMEFFSSFGGNPVSCVIGHSVLDVIEEEGLQSHAFDVGQYLITQLLQLKSDTSFISDVRGSGLFMGIELTNENGPATQLTSKVVDQLKDNGILLGIDGPHHNVIKFKPPMCFKSSNADFLTEQLSLAINNN